MLGTANRFLHPRQNKLPAGNTFRRNSLRLEAKFDDLIITIPLLFKVIHRLERKMGKVSKQLEVTSLLADLYSSPIYYGSTYIKAKRRSQFEAGRLLSRNPCGQNVDKTAQNGSVLLTQAKNRKSGKRLKIRGK